MTSNPNYLTVKNLFISLIFCSTISICSFSQEANSSLQTNPKRLALVIGNGNYLNSTLANPENDARSMKAALQEVGFDVLEFENLNQGQMKKAIDEFGMKLRNYQVGLFYYAGHGIQTKGYNYLIPVDASLLSEEQVEYDCVQADRVLALMEASGAKVNILILDACRNNPFERSWTRSASGKGLAFMNAPSGTLIAYATAPGSLASDGSGNNGLYTSAILESIKIPNSTVLQMFQNVRSIVSMKSNKQQIPWESTSLTGDFFFYSGNSTSNNYNISNSNITEAQDIEISKPEILNKSLNSEFSNDIMVTKIIPKVDGDQPNDDSIEPDTVLYATLNKGINVSIKPKSYLNLYMPTFTPSPVSGKMVLSKPKKIGHIYITSSFNNTSEGELFFKKDFHYQKSFDNSISYAKIKQTWSTAYVNTRISNAGSPGIGGGYILYNQHIGGYIAGGIFSSSGEYSEGIISGGVVKSITYTTALQIGMGYDGQLTIAEIGALTRLKKITILYGIYAGHDKVAIDLEPGLNIDFYAFGVSLGIGYNF